MNIETILPLIRTIRLLRLYSRHFFAFNPPELRCLVASELSIEGEFYLRLYWKVKDGFKVKIEKYATIYGCERSIVLQIPNGLDEIELVYSNVWKKKKQKLYLPKRD